MKKALISYQGWVSQIVNPGEEYEIYEGPDATIAWVDAPDEIQLDWTLEWSPSQQKMVWVERDGGFTDLAVARKVAYGPIEQQLDLIYHDIATHGQLDQNGDWYNHIVAVKQMIEPPSSQAAVNPADIAPETLLAKAATTEPSPDKPNMPSTQEMPAWKRYTGWRGDS